MRLASLAVFACLLTSPALADTQRLTITCASTVPWGDGATQCNTPGPVNFLSDGDTIPYAIRLTAPRSHCSEVQYRVTRAVDNASLASTTRMKPGETQNLYIGSGWPAGVGNLFVYAIGFKGGCNADGTIQSWGLTASVFPVP